ncbi:hypothetical protein BLOT_008302 [Blomia tropicalis]|nr:hypothetical protein BLOT_008302 [Blomia tropicalis]
MIDGLLPLVYTPPCECPYHGLFDHFDHKFVYASVGIDPSQTWNVLPARYDTDYSELYKGLAVVIGFFLFLVLLLLIFILISYLRKWYRLKKRPDSANVDDVVTVGPKGEHRRPIDPTMAKCQMGGQAPGKRYSKSGVPSASGSQQSTPLIKSLPKSSLTSIPVEIIDGKMMKSIHNQHLQQQGYPVQMPLSNQPPITSASQQQQNAHYQEFPTHTTFY